MYHDRIRGFLFRFIGCSESAVRGKAPGRSFVLPCPGERRAHRCDPHPRSRWRHELQASGLSGSLPGFRRRHLPALHLQSPEPGLQGEGVSRRVGENHHSVFLWRHCRGSGSSQISCVPTCRTTWGHWRTSTSDTYLLEVRSFLQKTVGVQRHSLLSFCYYLYYFEMKAHFYNIPYYFYEWPLCDLVLRQVDGLPCSCGFSQTAGWWIGRRGAAGCHLPLFPLSPTGTGTSPSAAGWWSPSVAQTPVCAICVWHRGHDVREGRNRLLWSYWNPIMS